MAKLVCILLDGTYELNIVSNYDITGDYFKYKS
jgi:hypothetical protein